MPPRSLRIPHLLCGRQAAAPSTPPATPPAAPGLPLTLQIAASRAAALPPDEFQRAYGPRRAAFVAFRAGQGSLVHWMHLVDAANLGADLANHQIASDHTATFASALDAFTAVFDRQQRTGSWTLKGTEIAALDLALVVHRVQLEHCSRGELLQAEARVVARAQAALAGHPPPGTRVCDATQAPNEQPTQAAA